MLISSSWSTAGHLILISFEERLPKISKGGYVKSMVSLKNLNIEGLDKKKYSPPSL
jgi:hypothetical protein